MDDKIDRLTKSVDELKRQLLLMQTKINLQETNMDKILKDVGGSDSKNLSDVIYKMDSYMSRDSTDGQTIMREVIETRRATTNIEIMIKEIMKGMTVIYSHVDELEENLLPERQTK